MRLVERAFLRLAVLGAAAIYAQDASALMVTYEWVPTTNSPTPNGGVGTLTLDSAAITDPNNFSAVAAGSLVSVSYQWQHGQALTNATPGFSSSVAAPGWSAAGGFLTTNFQTAAGVLNMAGVAYNPIFVGFGTSNNQAGAIGTMAAENDVGNWRFKSVSSVPLPAAIWLLVSGLAGFTGLRRRKH